jgi:hypothetical protein
MQNKETRRPNKSERSYFKQLEEKLQKNNDALRMIGSLYLSNQLNKEQETLITEGRIGVWKKEKDGYHLDENAASEWNFWCKSDKIPEKGSKTRVVFLGESAARGYFYDPSYNPCKEMDFLLREYAGKDYEVIDLARTDLNYPMLMKLIRETKELDPDMMVVYAGNNWDCNDLWEKENLVIWDILKDYGYDAVLEYFNERLKQQVQKLYKLLTEEFKGIPILVVIPEFNLLDWQDPALELPAEDGAVLTNWIAHMDKLSQLSSDGKYQEVIAQSLANSPIYEKLATRELNLLAACYHELDNVEKEIECKKRAKDIAILFPKITTPRTVSALQKAMREEAISYDMISTIDIEKIFLLVSGRIDRKYYMDYCHLTHYGTQKVAIEIVKKIMEHFENPLAVKDSDAFLKSKQLVTDKAESEAHLLAAMHNAHWGQGEAIIKYHLQRAVEYYPESKSSMYEFVKLQNRILPIWMSKNAEEYITHSSEQLTKYLGNNKGLRLDSILMKCVIEVLDNKKIADELLAIRQNVYGMHDKPINLLKPEYYVSAISMSEAQYNWFAIPEKLKRYGYYAAYSDSSEFNFVTDEKIPFTLELVCRMRQKAKDVGTLSVSVNGKQVHTGKIGEKWKKVSVLIPAELIVKDLNKVQCSWSGNFDINNDYKKFVLENLEIRKIPDILPIYAEVCSALLSR